MKPDERAAHFGRRPAVSGDWSFREIRGGVEVTDEIHYMLRGGPFATLMNDLIVRRRLKKIFEYRATVLSEKLGVMEKPPPNSADGR